MIPTHTIWKVYRAPSGCPPITPGQNNSSYTHPHFGDWLRLLVGKCLSLANVSQQGTNPVEVDYLVLGVPVKEMQEKGDRDGLKMAASAVKADFKQLRESIDELKRMIKPEATIKSPESFLRSFYLLINLRLPTDRSCWIATDEGLSIIHWGHPHIRSRPLLQWTPPQLSVIESQMLAEIGAEHALDGAESPKSQRPMSIGNLIEYKPTQVSKRRWDWVHSVLLGATVICLCCICLLLLWRSHHEKRDSGSAVQASKAEGELPAGPSKSGGESDSAGSVKGQATQPTNSGLKNESKKHSPPGEGASIK